MFEGCRELEACPIADESLRSQYQDTVGGFASAFMTAYVQVDLVNFYFLVFRFWSIYQILNSLNYPY